MKAVIMAGGEGTRLRPLTSNAPKPMMPLANRPMMEHILNLLVRHGFDDIVVTLAFMPEAIRGYFGDGSDFGVRMTYATEETPLGTAGSVGNAREHLDERFLVISGDVLTDIDLTQIVRFHEKKAALATIGLTAVENPLEFGIVITNDDGSIERFLEKPTWGQVFSDHINTGIFVCEPEIFDWIEPDRPVDFSSEVFPALLSAGKPMFGAVTEGYWEDVGTLDAYVRAHKDILDEKVAVDIGGFRISEGVWLGEEVQIDPAARIEGPAVIGDYCRIEAGVRLGEYAVLGRNVRIRRDADLVRSVVADNSYLGEGVRLRATVIGRHCDLRANVRCEEGTVIGDECFVGDDASLSAGVKVYPFKTIEAGATVNQSIVWESRGARTLFGRHGVAGLANVDITPELATRVAMAFATTLKSGSTVITSRDSSRAARMLKRAVMAGLNAGGIDVLDLEVASVPVTRFITRSPRASAGLTVRLLANDPQQVALEFFDNDGADLSGAAQRKIERLFDREDYRRVLPGEIGDIGFPPRALEHYADALESTVDIAAVRDRRFKLVIDYAYGSASYVMPQVLSKLGAEALALNPYVSTPDMLSFDMGEHAAQVAALVRASSADLGAVIEPSGEVVTIVDADGVVLTPHQMLLAFLALLPARAAPGSKVAVPVTTTRSAEAIAAQGGLELEWTKLAASALASAATESGVVCAGSPDGGMIFPEFLPAFDAAATLVKLLELLALSGRPLQDVVASLPPLHLAHEAVITPWEQKGLVMRNLVERAGDRPTVLVDGVKVLHPEGWALALPDPDEPITHIWAEGDSDADARRLAQEYARRIRQLTR